MKRLSKKCFHVCHPLGSKAQLIKEVSPSFLISGAFESFQWLKYTIRHKYRLIITKLMIINDHF